MLLSLAMIVLMGLVLGFVCKKIHLPALVGMIATGILLGPYVLNLIDPKVLNISSELRRIALIIILMRAGLSLNVKGLRQVGRSAILMCFLPAAFEMTAYVIVAPWLLGISRLDAAIMGSVLAAVSPAVIVPRMIRLSEEKYGTAKQIPEMILAGASVDDVFVIVMFSAFTGIAQGGSMNVWQFAQVPVSIALGLAFGLGLGLLLCLFFKKFHMRDSLKVIILLSLAFLLDAFEANFGHIVPFSGLIAVMGMGIGIQKKHDVLAKRVSVKFNKLWILAEVVLFVLVGACVDISYTKEAGLKTLAVIGIVLVFRMIGVLVCVAGTKLNFKERIFCVFSYIPKATVQAAIGSVPLAMGLPCGQIVLTVAVVGILITAPLGALLIDVSYKRLLEREEVEESEGAF